MLDWRQIDSVPLDADRTVRDLPFDNVPLSKLLPECYGAGRGDRPELVQYVGSAAYPRAGVSGSRTS